MKLEINKLFDHSQKDRIGKYFFSEAIQFALKNEFGKSYEFFKQGLNIITCDCETSLYWLQQYSNSEKVLFEDININHVPSFEYYFVKAFVMSFEEDKKSLYLALDAIDRYISINTDDYGLYVRGRILFALGEYHEALLCFETANSHNSNQKFLYRIGLAKEHLNKEGIFELTKAFLANPYSSCCLNKIKKSIKKHGFVINSKFEVNENPNILVKSFIDQNNENEFLTLFETILTKQLFESSYKVDENSRIIIEFIQEISRSLELLINSIYESYLNQEFHENYNEQLDDRDYNEGSRGYGYESWDDMSFYEAFEGDIDAWNEHNQ
jgi:tetratricopeptide (TPR) repeat protein